jgi:hypothetical protein
MVGKFAGRDIIVKPTCPFCGMSIERPKELEVRMPTEMPVGSCSCGAVYACDVTGHNLGTALIDALVFGCSGDWDLAWDLLPEDDYLEKMVENYDHESHLIVHGGIYKGRRVTGTLYFIRLHQDIREVTAEGVQKRLNRATPGSPEPSPKRRGKKSFSKKEVELLVNNYEVEPLLKLAAQDKRIIRDLQRLLYSVDKLIRWRAADVLGRVAAVIAKYDPRAISKLLSATGLSNLVDICLNCINLRAIGVCWRKSFVHWERSGKRDQISYGKMPFTLFRFSKILILKFGVMLPYSWVI